MAGETAGINHDHLLRLALLDFIKITDRYEREGVPAAKMSFGKPVVDPEDLDIGVAVSRQKINEIIKRLGGLPLRIDATHDTPEHQIVLTEWIGIDPETPFNHEWRRHNALPGEKSMSIPLTAIDEMRTDTLRELGG